MYASILTRILSLTLVSICISSAFGADNISNTILSTLSKRDVTTVFVVKQIKTAVSTHILASTKTERITNIATVTETIDITTTTRVTNTATVTETETRNITTTTSVVNIVTSTIIATATDTPSSITLSSSDIFSIESKISPTITPTAVTSSTRTSSTAAPSTARSSTAASPTVTSSTRTSSTETPITVNSPTTTSPTAIPTTVVSTTAASSTVIPTIMAPTTATSSVVTSTTVSSSTKGLHSTRPTSTTNTSNVSSTSASTSPASTDLEFTKSLLTLINNLRSTKGLHPMTINEKLINAAKIQSEYQYSIGELTHDNPRFNSILDRFDASGVYCDVAAENTASGSTDPTLLFEAWKNSPGHLENILGNYTTMGAAYYELYSSNEFCK